MGPCPGFRTLVKSLISIRRKPYWRQIGTSGPSDRVFLPEISELRDRGVGSFVITFSIPRMCIFATISDVKRMVTTMSTLKVIHCMGIMRSKVLGVLQLTDAKLSKAHVRISLRTHL